MCSVNSEKVNVVNQNSKSTYLTKKKLHKVTSGSSLVKRVLVNELPL